MFIHGLGQLPDSWDKVVQRLNKNDNILCPNLTTHIKENKNSDYYSLYSRFVDLLNGQDEVTNLCGLSLGGILTLNYAIDYPEKVNTLILIGTQYKMPKILLKFQNLIFRLMPQSIFEKIGLSKSEIINLTNSMMELDFTESLKNITCPTLIVFGTKDKANTKASIELSNLIPNARLELLEDVGHEINTQAPEKLAKVINNFYYQAQGQ